MKLDTLFFEHYARITLADLLGGRYKNLVNRDKPDLQDRAGNFGIEVTRAMEESRSEMDALESELMRRPVEMGEQNRLKPYLEQGEDTLLYDGKEVSFGADELKTGSDALLAAVRSKIVLLPQYAPFSEYGLYVFSYGDISGGELRQAMEIIRREQAALSRQYKMLFVNDLPGFHLCDLAENTMQTFTVSPQKLRAYRRAACLAEARNVSL